MASNLDFTQYVCEQIKDAGDITYRKMFGEYGVYCNGKIFALICDNQLFIKITEVGKSIIPKCKTSPPYKGAKPYFLIEDLEDTYLLTLLIQKTCEELPCPKPRKKKSK